MQGFVKNIAEVAEENENFRKVLYTTKNSQLVVMHLKAEEEIGMETHDLDQTLYIVQGEGKAILDGVSHTIQKGSVVVVPKGCKHNVINGQKSAPMKLYTVYAPPHHKDGVVHKTKEDSEKSEEHFDGETTE